MADSSLHFDSTWTQPEIGREKQRRKGARKHNHYCCKHCRQQPKHFATGAMMPSYWLKITHGIGSILKCLKHQWLKKDFVAELIISKIGLFSECDMTYLFKLTAVFLIIAGVQSLHCQLKYKSLQVSSPRIAYRNMKQQFELYYYYF